MLTLTTFDKSASSLHETLPSLSKDTIPEISVYFVEAWGNRSRIDYGSGMELNFLCWLYVQCRSPSCLLYRLISLAGSVLNA
jgi:Phosphotyrosyl phosphate activator (PTPA) protein